MQRAALLFILVAWSVYCAPAFSASYTVCYKSGKRTTSDSEYQISGLSSASVPAANMPLGSVVWRSHDIVVEVTCERLVASKSYPIRIRQSFLFGSVNGLWPGYTFQGVDYLMNGGVSEWINTTYTLGENVGDKVTFNLVFSWNIQRWGDNNVPASGSAFNNSRLPPIVVEVPNGPHNVTDSRQLSIYANNPGIKLTDCSADVRISKNTIDFNEVSAFRATNNVIAKQVPFEIFTSRSCAGKFKLNATLKPLVSNSHARGDFLIPTENDSIGIRIRNQGNGKIFPFDQRQELADLTSSTSQTNRYVAELVWQTDKPKLGRFEAGATLQIEYQ
ncbi:fimbrial protein [Burkholderia sp. BCC1640]|uniref:fimbrial protein n=1 Tax=Burkholderia sp. BCC1640 TaxID=2676294 RepID=UPI00158967A1|nr:fimbrial protein [Burkholderia sp. BCC1640]